MPACVLCVAHSRDSALMKRGSRAQRCAVTRACRPIRLVLQGSAAAAAEANWPAALLRAPTHSTTIGRHKRSRPTPSCSSGRTKRRTSPSNPILQGGQVVISACVVESGPHRRVPSSAAFCGCCKPKRPCCRLPPALAEQRPPHWLHAHMRRLVRMMELSGKQRRHAHASSARGRTTPATRAVCTPATRTSTAVVTAPQQPEQAAVWQRVAASIHNAAAAHQAAQLEAQPPAAPAASSEGRALRLHLGTLPLIEQRISVSNNSLSLGGAQGALRELVLIAPADVDETLQLYIDHGAVTTVLHAQHGGRAECITCGVLTPQPLVSSLCRHAGRRHVLDAGVALCHRAGQHHPRAARARGGQTRGGPGRRPGAGGAGSRSGRQVAAHILIEGRAGASDTQHQQSTPRALCGLQHARLSCAIALCSTPVLQGRPRWCCWTASRWRCSAPC